MMVVKGERCPILVVCHDDRVYALDNRCPHLGFPLHRGSVADGISLATGITPASTSGHAPWSEDGCVLFVKLRQFHPEDLERVAIDTRSAEWLPGIARGIAVLPLHGFGSERVSLVRWAPHTRFVPHVHPGGEEIFVLDGALGMTRVGTRWARGSATRLAASTCHSAWRAACCT